MYILFSGHLILNLFIVRMGLEIRREQLPAPLSLVAHHQVGSHGQIKCEVPRRPSSHRSFLSKVWFSYFSSNITSLVAYLSVHVLIFNVLFSEWTLRRTCRIFIHQDCCILYNSLYWFCSSMYCPLVPLQYLLFFCTHLYTILKHILIGRLNLASFLCFLVEVCCYKASIEHHQLVSKLKRSIEKLNSNWINYLFHWC